MELNKMTNRNFTMFGLAFYNLKHELANLGPEAVIFFRHDDDSSVRIVLGIP